MTLTSVVVAALPDTFDVGMSMTKVRLPSAISNSFTPGAAPLALALGAGGAGADETGGAGAGAAGAAVGDPTGAAVETGDGTSVGSNRTVAGCPLTSTGCEVAPF